MNLPFQCGSVNGVVSSQARSYSYDRMGNRLSLTQGSGAEAITTHTPFGSINQSQQPTLVLHDRKVELTGQVAAGETAQVTFNGPGLGSLGHGLGQTGDPRGFRATTQIPGTEGMMLRTLVSSGGTEKAGYLYVPPAEEVLGYDLWGNLIRDARWEYTWDGNNRLVDLWERHAEANATPRRTPRWRRPTPSA